MKRAEGASACRVVGIGYEGLILNFGCIATICYVRAHSYGYVIFIVFYDLLL